MKEVWKPVPEYKGLYEVSNTGKIKNRNGMVLRTFICSMGYERTSLYKDGVKRNFHVHRLVAEMFVDNRDNKDQVNHIDGNKLNNLPNNLEWCTASENRKHALRTGLAKSEYSSKRIRKAVRQFDKSGRLVGEYRNVSQARIHTGFSCSGIAGVCKGNHKTCGGYIWRYVG